MCGSHLAGTGLGAGKSMQMVRALASHMHSPLGIEVTGLGRCVGMMVLYLFEREKDRHRFGLVYQETFSAGFSGSCGCAAAPSKVGQAPLPRRSMDPTTSLHQNTRKAHHCRP